MIQPEAIRRKAAALYPRFLRAWLEGARTFFPRALPARMTPDTADPAATIQWVRDLRDRSKEATGFGYTVNWREVNSRKLGRNQFPTGILFETQEDFLRFVDKGEEFRAFADAVDQVRTAFPELNAWVCSNIQAMIAAAPDVSGLIEVCRYLRDHPRPNVFPRELPVSVDSKFVERHGRLLREWLDIVLPPATIRSDEDHFARRFGLRYPQPHILVRLLDPRLREELSFPCSELSVPLHVLGEMPVRDVAVVVVENKVNLLTLPPLQRTIGIGGLGRAVTLLRYLAWLNGTSITYWGDLDVEGFEILSTLRLLFPQTTSVFMDEQTLDRWPHAAVPGSGAAPDIPPLLHQSEQAAFVRCRDENIRVEQERLPQAEVLLKLGSGTESLRPNSLPRRG